MIKLLILLLSVRQMCSTNEQVISISEYPLFTKILSLIDQLLLQVRKMQTLITRTHSMIDQMPDHLRPLFKECFTTKHNTSEVQYFSNLNEAEATRIPQIKARLQRATTLEQQFNVMNITERVVADISFNVVKPSLTFVTEILDCIKIKSLARIA